MVYALACPPSISNITMDNCLGDFYIGTNLDLLFVFFLVITIVAFIIWTCYIKKLRKRWNSNI